MTGTGTGAGAGASAGTGAAVADGPVVGTTAGPVRGLRRAGSATFLGIPYAEAPFGPRRFLAPEPCAPWSGVRDAVAYGPTPQRRPLAEVTAIPEPSIPGEDTLSVNVFTPDPVALDRGAGLPVLVWIHGGGYVAGSPASPWYDGAAFTRDGVVVVTISYRLGFEGFGWLPDAPVNRGALDWLLALEWVRDNIAQFGGDPDRVTIAGQSAGGGAVMTLLAMPRARGLFTRAAAMSASPADIPLAAAELATVALADRLGVPVDRAGFAAVPEHRILDAVARPFTPVEQPTAEGLLTLASGLGGVRPFGPVVDGEVHTGTVRAGLLAGSGQRVPLLIGYTREEFGAVTHGHRDLFEAWDPERLLAELGVAPDVARAYVAALPGRHPGDVLGQYTTDLVFRRHLTPWVEARRDAPAATWVYDFAWRSPLSGLAEHCLDVPFVWDVLADEHVARLAGPDAPQSLADDVHRALVDFVRGGSPGWPAYAGSGAAMVFDERSRVEIGTYASAQALAGGL